MKKIILLIDDDEDELDFFMEALHEVYFPVDCIFARNAEDALKLLCYTVPDFIFLDYNMPQMNGLQCLAEIKKMKNVQNVPVILYSTGINEELTKKAMALGAGFCIRKPNKVRTFSEILQRILAVHTEFKMFFAISKNN